MHHYLRKISRICFLSIFLRYHTKSLDFLLNTYKSSFSNLNSPSAHMFFILKGILILDIP